jgi:hypothetical protein
MPPPSMQQGSGQLPPRRELRSSTLQSNAVPLTNRTNNGALMKEAAAITFTAATQIPNNTNTAPAHISAQTLHSHVQPIASVPSSVSHPVIPTHKRAASVPLVPSSTSNGNVGQSSRGGVQSGPVTHRLPGAAGQPRPLAEGAPPRTPAEQAAEDARQFFTVPEIISDPSVTRINSQGITVCKQYKRGRYLGKGGFAVCYELTSLDSGRTYAGKIIPRITLANKPSAQKKMVQEIKIHRSINHTNVVKFERFFEGLLHLIGTHRFYFAHCASSKFLND